MVARDFHDWMNARFSTLLVWFYSRHHFLVIVIVSSRSVRVLRNEVSDCDTRDDCARGEVDVVNDTSVGVFGEPCDIIGGNPNLALLKMLHFQNSNSLISQQI
jgi:hypothetical protein